MGNILEAMQWLKSGLKIRRHNWFSNNFLTLTKTGKIINNYGDDVELSFINSLLADDWEVYKEDKENNNQNMFPSIFESWKRSIKRDIDKVKTSKELREFLETAKGLDKEEDEDEVLNFLDVIKDKNVKPKNLFIKVHDMESKKEGWISFNQIIKKFISEN